MGAQVLRLLFQECPQLTPGAVLEMVALLVVLVGVVTVELPDKQIREAVAGEADRDFLADLE
jgi:hypothetical protein